MGPRRKYKIVGCNDIGRLVGEYHPRAVLTDHDVELIRELREQHGMSYDVLADKFEASKWTIRNICKYRRRVQVVSILRFQ